MDFRKSQYKQGIEIEKTRNNRTISLQNIRKSKRKDQIRKRRKADPNFSNTVLLPTIETIRIQLASTSTISEEAKITLLKSIRIWLSSPIERTVSLNVALTQQIVDFIRPYICTTIQPSICMEGIWCAINIASGNHEVTLASLPCAENLIEVLVKSQDDECKQRAAWALGNIAGDSKETQSYLTENFDILSILAQLLLEFSPDSEMTRTVAWTISNLARGGNTSGLPFLVANIDELVIAKLSQLACLSSEQIIQHRDVEQELCWVLVYLSAREFECLDRLMQLNVTKSLFMILKVVNDHNIATLHTLLVPILRCITNILTAKQVEFSSTLVLDQNHALIQVLDTLLSQTALDASQDVVYESIRCVCQIFEFHQYETQGLSYILNETSIVSKLCWLLCHANCNMRRESGISLFALGQNKNLTVVNHILNTGNAVDGIVKLLTSSDIEMVDLGLDFVDVLLSASEIQGNFELGSTTIEKHHGMEVLEKLAYQSEMPEYIMEKAYGILKLMEEGANEDNTEVMHQEARTIGRGKALLRPSWM